MAFGRAFERALGSSVSYIGSLAVFICAFHLRVNLTFPIIFSVMQTMILIKVKMECVVVGIDLIHEAKVTFSRFANIFNIEKLSMVNIEQSQGNSPQKHHNKL